MFINDDFLVDFLTYLTETYINSQNVYQPKFTCRCVGGTTSSKRPPKDIDMGTMRYKAAYRRIESVVSTAIDPLLISLIPCQDSWFGKLVLI
jgi:hypothetical protein